MGSLAQAAGYYSYPGLQYQKGIVSGVYTPTLTILQNLDSVTANEAIWWRIGSMVFVRGSAEINATSTASDSVFYITFPLASTLDNARDCKGFIFEHLIPSNTGTVLGEAVVGPTRCAATWRPSVDYERTVIFDFVYPIKGQ